MPDGSPGERPGMQRHLLATYSLSMFVLALDFQTEFLHFDIFLSSLINERS